MAIEVSTLAAILGFSKHLKMANCPQGRNRAPFRSTIDGFRDNGNQSFDPGGHLGFFGTSQNSQNVILGKLVEIELRFALRSTVAEIMAIEVLGESALSNSLRRACRVEQAMRPP